MGIALEMLYFIGANFLGYFQLIKLPKFPWGFGAPWVSWPVACFVVKAGVKCSGLDVFSKKDNQARCAELMQVLFSRNRLRQVI